MIKRQESKTDLKTTTTNCNSSNINNNIKTKAFHANQPSYRRPRLSQLDAGKLLVICSVIGFLILSITIVESIKRTQYHEQGVHGPHSYKFGYTSGDYKNPQERHEVSDKKGHVKGWYSYKDPHGKIIVYHYEAHPKKGFKVHKHKKHG